MKKKKKLLLISPNSIETNCGVAKYTFYLANSLKKDYNVKILTEKSKNLSKELFQLESWKLNEFFNYISVIKKFRPDIIHIQLADILLNKGFLVSLIPIISIFYSKKIIQTWHEPCGNKNFLKFFLLTFNSIQLISVRPDFKNLIKKSMFFIFRFHFLFKKIYYIKSSYLIKKRKISKNLIIKIRKKYLNNKNRLIVSFGNSYKNKRFEKLFQIIDKKKDQLIIVSKLSSRKKYDRKIINLQKKYSNNSKILNNFNDFRLFELLTSADTILLLINPYVGNWNTTFNIARLSKSLIIATSKNKEGYYKKENIYYLKEINLNIIKDAIDKYSGKKNNLKLKINSWKNVSNDHIKFYAL